MIETTPFEGWTNFDTFQLHSTLREGYHDELVAWVRSQREEAGEAAPADAIQSQVAQRLSDFIGDLVGEVSELLSQALISGALHNAFDYDELATAWLWLTEQA